MFTDKCVTAKLHDDEEGIPLGLFIDHLEDETLAEMLREKIFQIMDIVTNSWEKARVADDSQKVCYCDK